MFQYGGKEIMSQFFAPSALAGRDPDRMRAYRENLDFYNGSQWLGSGRERRLVFNYARVNVDKATSYLMAGFNFAVAAVDPPMECPRLSFPKAVGHVGNLPGVSACGVDSRLRGNDKGEYGEGLKALARAAEAALRQVYDENDLRQLDFEAEIDAAVLGDGCYKVTFDHQEKRVRVTAPDVTGLHAWRAGDDLNQVWRVASRYRLAAEECERLYPNVIPEGQKPYRESTPQAGPLVDSRLRGNDIRSRGDDKRASAWVTELWTASRFTIYLDDAVIRDGPNPYGFIPFIIFPNMRRPQQAWGESDIPALVESQRELNRAISQLSRILELSGNPIAVLENVESSSGIMVQPGAVWNLPEDGRAYLLDLLKGGGARLHVEYIDLLYRCMHDLAESPRAAFGGAEQELSGVALEVELHSLLQKVNRKRNIRTAVYRKRNEMILKLLEMFSAPSPGSREGQVPCVIPTPSRPQPGGEESRGEGSGAGVSPCLRHRIVWGPVIPQDKARAVQNEQALVVSGVHSRKRAMDELGVEDPEAEFGAWLAERRAIMIQNKELDARRVRSDVRERSAAAGAAGEMAP